MFAILGEIEFDIVTSPTGLERRGSADWARHNLIQGKPKLEWTGEGLEEISLDISLHVALGDPEARLKQLRDAKADHQPLAFVLGNGNYLGPYVISDISTTVRRTAAAGGLWAATVQVSLIEYTGQFTRPPARSGLLDAAGNLIAPLSQNAASARPSLTQQLIGNARTAGNVLRAGVDLFRDVRNGGSPASVLSQVPQLLQVTSQALAPLQGMTSVAGLLQDGAPLAAAGSAALGDVQTAISSLSPVSLESVLTQVDYASEKVTSAAGHLDEISQPLLDKAVAVITRRA